MMRNASFGVDMFKLFTVCFYCQFVVFISKTVDSDVAQNSVLADIYLFMAP